MSTKKDMDAYEKVLVRVFQQSWKRGSSEVLFSKDDLMDAAEGLKIRIKNVPDILYTFRSRRALPDPISKHGPWVIASRGSGKYAFVRVTESVTVEIPALLKEHAIPYAVPEIVATHLSYDEQGLLTIARYNRLMDVFSGIACFHLQSHVRTQIDGHGQVEIDELYVGVDKEGSGYVLPVEAKNTGESLGIDKAVSLTLFGQGKYPKLKCRPIAIVREAVDVFTCVEFEPTADHSNVSVLDMRRYRLVRDEK